MTQYVKGIAYTLSVFDDNKQKMEYYEAMSWAGLEETKAYKALTEDEKIILLTQCKYFMFI